MTLAWAQSIISLNVYAQGKDNMAVKVRMG